MPGFNGTGPMGMGPMTGGGRGFCSPWGIGAVARMHGLPRRTPYAPRMAREQEMEFLKSEAQAMRDELKELETRIGQLSKEKG